MAAADDAVLLGAVAQGDRQALAALIWLSNAASTPMPASVTIGSSISIRGRRSWPAISRVDSDTSMRLRPTAPSLPLSRSPCASILRRSSSDRTRSAPPPDDPAPGRRVRLRAPSR